MQALFLRFFEKKLFLLHYEQEKISKKFRFFCFFRASPSTPYLKTRFFDPKQRTKTAGKRPGNDIRSASPPQEHPIELGSSSFHLISQTYHLPRFTSVPARIRTVAATMRPPAQFLLILPRLSRIKREGRVRHSPMPPGQT